VSETNLKKSSRNEFISIICVILFTLLFFFVNCNMILHKDIFIDEVFSYNIPNHISYGKILSGIDTSPPLYYTLLKTLPHDNFFFMRCYSLIIMASAIMLLFIILRDKFGYCTAWIAFLIAIFSSTISEYATQVRMYSLLFLFSVFILEGILQKRYYQSLIFMGLSLLTHYYAVLWFIPFTIAVFIAEKERRKKIITIEIIMYIILGLILLTVVYNQFIGYNPYKVPPPHDPPNFHYSFPSMISFMFTNSSTLHLLGFFTVLLFICAFISFLIIYKEKDKLVEIFIPSCFISVLFLFLCAHFLNFPFHHRYFIMFFPVFYTLWARSLVKARVTIRYVLGGILAVFLLTTFINYQLHPSHNFQDIAKGIKCPANILHETPFSYLPMSLYLPNCNHYFAQEEDWLGLTSESFFTSPDRINNMLVQYDYYIHYFEDYKVPEYIFHSTNQDTLITIELDD
jgi:hypothetical protein